MSTVNRKKIALFMPTLDGGGAERVMVTLADEFAQAGHAVDLVLSSARGALQGDVPPGVRVVDLAATRLIKSTMPLAAYLRRERPDSMLSAMVEANCIAVWARALSCTPTRLVLSEHSTLSVASANRLEARKRRLPSFARWTYPHADAVLAVSTGVADDLALTTGFPRQRIQVMYNPVITQAMLAKSHEPLDHPWFKPGEPPVVLAVGRLVTPKDFATLIRAFAILRTRRAVRLMILGEGDKRQELATLIDQLGLSSEVALPGFARNPYKFMRAARVFVLSSRWEGFGNVVAEALACGANVISTDCPSGPAEILEGGKWGRLVPVGQTEPLAQAIDEALDSRASAPGLDRALRRFTASFVAERYLGALVPMAGDASRASE